MSGLVTAPAEGPDAVKDSEHVIAPARRGSILIAVREVTLATAAAVPLPRATASLAQVAMAREMRSR